MSFSELNQEQQAAVLAREREVLVLAGAGSGKTRTLVERVAHLIEHGASGYEIVCTTFTRAAAGEMRARLEARIGREARKVTISTFHGLGLGLLKKYGHHIGLRYGNLTVYTPLETEILIQHCGEQLGLYAKGKWKHGKRAMEQMFADIEQGLGEREDVENSPYFPLLLTFSAACRQNNAMPYYRLIHGLIKLAEDGKVCEFTNWKYFLVDEVQDMDTAQWRALAGMLEHRTDSELYAVGDLSQSIYGFRGAVPEHLQALIDESKLTVYELRSNYRSAPAIVGAANDLISHNTGHRVITMQAMREPVPHSLARLMDADSAGLADYIARQNWPYPPVVLCRNNRMLDKLSQELTARDVPHKRIGKQSTALHSPLFVKANAALKCIVNPFDETAFLMAHKGLGVDAGGYAKIRVQAAEEGKSGFEVYRESMGVDSLTIMPTEDSTMKEALEWFASGGGYQFDPLDGYGPEYCAWLEAYAAQHPTDTITEYLDWLALADVQDEMPAKDEEPGILLMTCHASKGLEFPCVIVAGCNKGVMPSKQAAKAGEAGIEDERRLMYVAVTRAMHSLILAVRPDKEGSGESPSRFLTELGAGNL